MTGRKALYLVAALFLGAAGCGSPTQGAAVGHAEGDGHDHDAPKSPDIEVTATQMATVGIKLGRIEPRYLGDAVRVNGEIAVNPQDVADISPLVPGVVSRIMVKEGQNVAAGQTVALIENGEVVTLQQDYLTAVDEKALAARELARQEALAAEGAGVARNLEVARTAARVAAVKVDALATRLRQFGVSPSASATAYATHMAVKSPVSGTVTAVNVTTGAYADQTSPLMTVVNSKGIYARLNLFEKDLARVKQGQHVAINVTNNPAVTVRGEVSEVTPALDPASKSASVRVRITDGAGMKLMPGMALTAYVAQDETQVDAVPESAIASIEGKNYIFVFRGIHDEADGTKAYAFHRMAVATGVSEGGYVAVTPEDPLAAGAQIVTDNVFYLASMTADHGEHNH